MKAYKTEELDNGTLILPESRYQYNFVLYQIGYEKCGKEHKFGPLLRDFFILHFLISGKGSFKVRGKEVSLKKGDVFLIPVNEIISYHADPEDPYEYFWVGFHGMNAEETLTQAGFFTDDVFAYNVGDDYDTIFCIMRDLCDIDEGEIKNNLYMLGDLYKLLGVLTKDNVPFIKVDSGDQILKKLMRYIEMNYSGKITVDNMTKLVNLHRSNIYRLFKSAYNTSPQEFLFNYRMDKALFMLKNSNMSVKEIAYAVGYNDPAYFSKMFKKKYAKSANQVRELL